MGDVTLGERRDGEAYYRCNVKFLGEDLRYRVVVHASEDESGEGWALVHILGGVFGVHGDVGGSGLCLEDEVRDCASHFDGGVVDAGAVEVV